MRFLLIGVLFCGSLMATPDEVLDFWFGQDEKPRTEIWFRGGDELDEEIRERFLPLVEQAANGQLDSWSETTRGKLALIVILDQFSRHVWRGTPEAYTQDLKARELALEMVQHGEDYMLAPLERAFVYLPFEHAEDRYFQERSVDCFEKLLDWAPVDQRRTFEAFLFHAEQHKNTIFRYGRFPYRNEILGRKSSPSERTFLAHHATP